MVCTAPGATMGSTISRFATGLAEEGIFVLSGFLGWPTRYDKIVRRRVQNSVLSLPISRTKVPHFPYYRSLGLLGNLFQNKGLAHFSVSSLRISKIFYGASQPSCCAARLLRAGKVVRPSQDGKFGKTERGLPEIVESPRAFSFRRAFPLSRFFERPNLAGRRKRGDVAAIWMHAKN